jgi:hypothetical protein
MFRVEINKDGKPVVLTDNVIIADQIRKESTQLVYFTASPTRLTAEALANGLLDVFDGTVIGVPEYNSILGGYILKLTNHSPKPRTPEEIRSELIESISDEEN